jgi:hypothetical protein
LEMFDGAHSLDYPLPAGQDSLLWTAQESRETAVPRSFMVRVQNYGRSRTIE